MKQSFIFGTIASLSVVAFASAQVATSTLVNLPPQEGNLKPCSGPATISTTTPASTTASTTFTLSGCLVPPPPMPQQSPMVLEVNGQGQVLLRGAVQTINTDSLTVKTWGGV